MQRIALARFMIVPAISTLIFLGCGKGTRGLVQNSEAKSSSGWAMKITDSSQPSTVKVKARSLYGGTQPERDESPPANQKWVLLSAELSPPAAAASLPVKQIKLAEATNSYAALAISDASDKGAPAFVYFKESAGLAQVSASGQMLWAIMRNDNTGEIDLIFQKAGSEKVFFLFAVPAAATNLTLQLSP